MSIVAFENASTKASDREEEDDEDDSDDEWESVYDTRRSTIKGIPVVYLTTRGGGPAGG